MFFEGNRLSKDIEMISRLSLIATSLFASLLVCPSDAQDLCVQYHLVPKTIYEKKQVTRYRLVDETSYETKQVIDQVPVYSTEKRERVIVTYVPHTTTTMQDEYYDVLRPVTETKYRERTWQETEYETVTEMRDEQYVVEEPVTETQFRTERVLVRKPVRKTQMRSEDVTSYRPVQTLETEYVPSAVLSNQLVEVPGSNRAQLDWIQRGYYWDAALGRYVFRRGGLHWTNPGTVLANQPTVALGVVPQQRARTTYVPETTRRLKPVDVIEYDEHIELRKVPIDIQTTSRRVATRKVPVEVQRPVTRTKTERVPYTETRMERVTKVRRVPVEKTELRRVEKVEPYERTNARWVEKTREVRVPTTVTRRVPYTETVNVPRTIWMKVPVDAFGNPMGNPIPIETPADRAPAIRETSQRVPNQAPSVLDRTTTETSSRTEPQAFQRIEYDRPARSQPTPIDKDPSDNIVVPETVPDPDNPETSLIQVRRRPVEKETNETSERTLEDEPVRILPENDDEDAQKPIPMEGKVVPGDSDDDTDESAPSDDLEDDVAGNDPRIG